MKKLMILAAAFGLNAWAHPPMDPACEAIKKACDQAGQKGHKGMACMHKVVSGETVEGVAVTDEQKATCKEKMEAFRAAHPGMLPPHKKQFDNQVHTMPKGAPDNTPVDTE